MLNQYAPDCSRFVLILPFMCLKEQRTWPNQTT